jgi:hydroxypyruvate reductase
MPLSDDEREMRNLARRIFERALAEASVEKAFERQVECDHGILRIGSDLYPLNSYSRVFVTAIGKAAHSLVEALQQRTGSRFEGIVASSLEPASQLRGFRYFRGGHPTPNAESVRAAEAMLKSLRTLDESALAIFLVSGGGSAMAEKAIDGEISLEELISTYRALVHGGAPIGGINAIRKHLSAVKGGRLAGAAHPAKQVSILVSDVPDNTPDALASGPTMPDSTTAEDCYALAKKYHLLEQFPASVRKLFERRALEETPKKDSEMFAGARWWTVLSNKTVIDTASAAAAEAGFAVEVDNRCDDWEYQRAADYLLNRVRELRQKTERACLISGGEVTVTVKDGGTGGRNQQFALACAAKIGGQQMTVLSAGTDGIDGNSPAAGAVVDGTTVTRASALGLDAGAHLAGFNAYPLFDRIGDAVMSGATGNNLRDLRLLLAF